MRNRLRGRNAEIKEELKKIFMKLYNDLCRDKAYLILKPYKNNHFLKLVRETISPPQGFQPAMKKLRNFLITSISVFLLSNV